RLDERAGRGVDEIARRREHAIQLRTVQKPERRQAIVSPRQRVRDAGELERNRRGRHGFPRVERASDCREEVVGGDARYARVGDDVANRRLRPLQRHRSAADGHTEFQIGERRIRHEDECTRRCQHTLHRAPPASVRTFCSKSASGSGRRPGSPRTIRTVPATAGRFAGGVTSQPELSEARTRRNTPWLKPTMYGTDGPCAPRKTTMRSSTANSGAPTTMLRKRPSSPPGTLNLTVCPSAPLR